MSRIKDRRRWPRLPLAIPVFVRGACVKGKEFLEFGTILNISAGGVLFATRKSLQEGSRISLEIPTAFPGKEVAGHAKRKFRARIVRTNGRDQWYRCAARFYSP